MTEDRHILYMTTNSKYTKKVGKASKLASYSITYGSIACQTLPRLHYTPFEAFQRAYTKLKPGQELSLAVAVANKGGADGLGACVKN